MEQLINRTPEIRIGQSYATLKSHPWFDDFSWVNEEADFYLYFLL